MVHNVNIALITNQRLSKSVESCWLGQQTQDRSQVSLRLSSTFHMHGPFSPGSIDFDPVSLNSGVLNLRSVTADFLHVLCAATRSSATVLSPRGGEFCVLQGAPNSPGKHLPAVDEHRCC